MDAAIALSGQVAGRIDSVRPVADIIADTVAEFHEAITRLTRDPLASPRSPHPTCDEAMSAPACASPGSLAESVRSR